MTPAELKTIREACGLSLPQLATMAGVQERTARYWESGHSSVPDDVAALVLNIDRTLDQAVAQALEVVRQQIAAHGGELPQEMVLLRYRTDADLAEFRADMAGMPASTHAALLYRTRAALADLHVASRIVYMEPDDYRAWLGREPDTEDRRAAWAALAKDL